MQNHHQFGVFTLQLVERNLIFGRNLWFDWEESGQKVEKRRNDADCQTHKNSIQPIHLPPHCRSLIGLFFSFLERLDRVLQRAFHHVEAFPPLGLAQKWERAFIADLAQGFDRAQARADGLVL